MACHHYIEANPVPARMVPRAEDHIWSSHGRNALGNPDSLIGEHECYRALGDTDEARQAAYRQGFEEGLTQEVIDTLRDATQRGWVPGRDSFRRQIESALGRRVGPPVSGRPRKTREEDAALLLSQADLI